MKRIAAIFIAAATIAIAASSCSSTSHTGYHKNLYKRHNGCMLSDEGCGWADKARD
jgi:hypothetical protein